MAITTITGLTASRMIEIEQASVVSGRVEGEDLILTTKGGEPITAGNVRGPKGRQGDPGGVEDATSSRNGGVRLAGNLGGTASEPKITGVLDDTVDVSNAKVSVEHNGSPYTFTLSQFLQHFLDLDESSNNFVRKGGDAKILWSGTEAQYDALPSSTKNQVGFNAVIRP